MVFISPVILLLLGSVACFTLFLLVLNALIRLGLRAPRVSARTNPSSCAVPFREVRLPTANSKQLHGWFVPATGNLPAPTLIVLHGWGGNSEMMLPLAAPFCRAGFALLFIDARNHGDSDADTFSSLPRFAEDLESALDWLLQQPETDSHLIGLIGHSVGAASALLLASQRCEIAAVVSLASFAHPEKIMRRYLTSRRVPFIPLGWYTLRYVQHVIGHRFDDIAPQNTIRKILCPVLLAHGIDDSTVPVEDALLIHSASRKDLTHLLLVDGDHDDYNGFMEHASEIVRFVADAMGTKAKTRTETQSATASPSSSVFSSPL